MKETTVPSSNTPRRRVADVRQDNPVMDRPPAIVERAPDAIQVRSRKVGKSGAVYLAGLPEGANVNVTQYEEQTYLVSSRPADELRALTASIPKAPASPFAALSAAIRGQKHDLEAPRIRRPYTGPIPDLALTDREEIGLELGRTKRIR